MSTAINRLAAPRYRHNCITQHAVRSVFSGFPCIEQQHVLSGNVAFLQITTGPLTIRPPGGGSYVLERSLALGTSVVGQRQLVKITIVRLLVTECRTA